MANNRTLQSDFESDIWDLAALLLDKHSELATKIVFEMAIESLNVGDHERTAMWAIVGSAIDELKKRPTKLVN